MSLALTSTRAALLAPWNRNALWAAARAVPSLDLRFAESKSLTDAASGQSLVTFTRASSGTYVGSDGLLKTATTNLLLQSEDFSTTWTLVAGTLSSNSASAPTGASTADKLIATNGGPNGQVAQGVTITSGATVTGSVFVKAGGFDRLELVLLASNNTTPYARATVNPNDGSITAAVSTANGGTNASASVVNHGNGWYRLAVTVTYPAVTSAGMRLNLFNSDASNGDGVKGVLLWGAQLEQSSTVGEYIPTTSTINSAPRFDHNPTTGESLGLLVEEQRTNLLLRSEEFGTTWTTTRANVSSDTSTAPNGTTTADKLIEDTTATNTHSINQASISFTSGLAYTFSCYVKQAERQNVRLALPSAAFTTALNAQFNLANGTVVATSAGVTSSVQAVGNNWYRCVVTATATTTASSGPTIFIGETAASTNISYTGDGTSGIYLWGAQLEAGAFPTSYIPTTAATATRSADVASDTSRGAAIRTLHGQFRSPASGTRPIVSLDDNSTNNRIELFTSGTDPKLLVTSGGSAQADIDAGGITANTTARLVARFNTNNFAASVSGGAEVLDATGTMPTVDQIRIGRDQAGNYLNGTITRITGWNDPLPILPSVSG